MRTGKILLISTASGVVGADISAFLGATLLGLLQATLAEQAALPPEQRHPVLMLIDEFQVYSGVNYQTMLAELRKYGGSFALATQSLAYLDRFDRALRSTVLANIDHLFALTMSREDAHLLALEEVEESDLTMLDDYQCYVRLSVGGRRQPLFSLALDAPPNSDQQQARMLIQQSQQRYARPVGLVDAALAATLERQRTAVPTKPAAAPPAAFVGADSEQHVSGNPNRKKRRGRGKARTSETGTPPVSTPQEHVMYATEEPDATI